MENSYEVAAELYDYIVDDRTRPDVGFFVDLAKEANGPVLELGCGTGRVLIPTARSGVDVIGVDLSPNMLAICQEKLAIETTDIRSRVRLCQADMRKFEFAQKFALVAIPFRPFQHLVEVDDQLACLERIHQHLTDDGKLVLDVFNPSLSVLIRDSRGVEDEEGPDFVLPDGRHVVRKVKFVDRDRINQVLSIELIYYVTDLRDPVKRLVHAFQMRYFFRYEMEHLLARAGFVVEALYGDYQKNPFSSTHSNDLVFVARKRR